jgi:hypothetical protein
LPGVRELPAINYQLSTIDFTGFLLGHEACHFDQHPFARGVIKDAPVLSAQEDGLLVWVKKVAGIIALLTCSSLASAVARAQSGDGSIRPDRSLATGIITDRIAAKDLRRWDAIKRIVFAEDFMGSPLHPTLRSMWEQLDKSRHAVYIELYCKSRTITNTAGSFHIELFDPLGERHVAVIRLYLSNIDRASVEQLSLRANGYIPFLGLTRVERYAEVLAHELAHTVHILSDLERARMVEEMIEQTNEEFLWQGRRYGYANIKPDLMQRIAIRDLILKELEEPADMIEMIVWKEIILGSWRVRRRPSR